MKNSSYFRLWEFECDALEFCVFYSTLSSSENFTQFSLNIKVLNLKILNFRLKILIYSNFSTILNYLNFFSSY